MRLHKRNRAARGATLVEMALFFPFIILLTFTIIQFSQIMNAIITVQYYAREAARYSCVHYKDGSYGQSSVDTYIQNSLATANSTIPYSALYAAPKFYQVSSTTTTLDDGKTVTPPSTVTVEVQYNMTKKYLFYPYVPGLPSSWTYTYYYTTYAEGS